MLYEEKEGSTRGSIDNKSVKHYTPYKTQFAQGEVVMHTGKEDRTPYGKE